MNELYFFIDVGGVRDKLHKVLEGPLEGLSVDDVTNSRAIENIPFILKLSQTGLLLSARPQGE